MVMPVQYVGETSMSNMIIAPVHYTVCRGKRTRNMISIVPAYCPGEQSITWQYVILPIRIELTTSYPIMPYCIIRGVKNRLWNDTSIPERVLVRAR